MADEKIQSMSPFHHSMMTRGIRPFKAIDHIRAHASPQNHKRSTGARHPEAELTIQKSIETDDEPTSHNQTNPSNRGADQTSL